MGITAPRKRRITGTTTGNSTLSNDGIRSLLWQERKGPDRSALRHLILELLTRDVPVQPADAGQHGDVLPALMRVSDRDGVDTRPGLELPNDLAGVGIDCNEFAGLFAGKQQAAAGRQ